MTSDPRDIVIVGAGGFAREVRHLLDSFFPRGEYRFKGYLGRDSGVAGTQEIGGEILTDPEQYTPQAGDRFILAIGDMDARRRITGCLEAKGAVFERLIHPTAFVAETAELGNGTLIYPFASVSNNAKLDDFVKLNYYASVGHDTSLGRCCLLAPYATVNGFGILEDYVYLSTRATVAPQVRIGAGSVLSANCAAMNDVPSDHFVFGVPGRVMRRLQG